MLEATAECHSNSIIHRDIKPDNFLLKTKIDSVTGEKMQHIKLADFGISCVYDADAPPTVKCGTMEYAAPEIISQPHYDKKVDCFSLGIILFELLSQFETT